MTPEEQACYDNLRADCDALAARLADWHKVADDRSAEIVRLNARLAEAEALLRQCQPYVALAVDNEYDGDKELVRGVAAFLAADSASVTQEKNP